MLFMIFFVGFITSGLGAVPVDNRIIDGAFMDIEDAPYQVTIIAGTLINSGGAIVSKNVIASVAILAFIFPPSHYKVRAGSSYSYKEGIVIDVEAIIVHDKYTDIFSVDYSIGLLKLATSLDLNGVTIAAVAMAPSGFIMPRDAEPIVTGYGVNNTMGRPLQKIQALAIPLLDQETCKEMLKPYINITDRMLCAKGRGSPCHFDGGGPFVWNKTLVGITSWNRDCGTEGDPGVWTRVSAVSDWAKEKIALWA